MNLLEPFSHPFFANAMLAGTAIAAACGLVGYFLVLRAQVFTGDALSHVAVTGALAALCFGVNPLLGLFVATVGVALLMGALGRTGAADDVVIGSIFAWVLGLGVLFLTIYTSTRSTANGSAGVTVLFGSIFGISAQNAVLAAVIGAAVCVATLSIARPLLFASIDPAVATARGVPVRLLGFGFLALAGVCAAEATQAVGALLLLGLLAAPAGAAQLISSRPFRALGLSVLIAVAEMWSGLLVSYLAPVLPPSFAILAVGTAGYLVALAAARLRSRAGNRRRAGVPDAAPAHAR